MLDRETRDHIRAMRDLIVRSKVRYTANGGGMHVQNIEGVASFGEFPLVHTPNRADRVNANYVDNSEGW